MDVQRKIEMTLKKAWTLVEAKQLEAGFRCFDEAIALAPQDDGLLVEKGVALFRAGRPSEAFEVFRAAFTKNPANLTARANAAKALVAIGRREEARALYEEGLALDPEHLGLLLGSGALLCEEGKIDEAIARFERAAAAKPREGEPWYRKAIALRARNDLEGALAAVEVACTLRPKYTDALQLRTHLLRMLGRAKQAWNHAIEALRAAGEGATKELLLEAGEAALLNEQAKEALGLAEKVIAKDKECGAGWFLKARAEAKLGNLAIAALCSGTGRMVEGKLEEALAEVGRAVALDPKYAAAWCNRAVILERLGRYEEALASYDQAIKAEPGAAILWHNKGNLLLGPLNRREEALHCFQREVKIDPRRWFDLPSALRTAVDQLG